MGRRMKVLEEEVEVVTIGMAGGYSIGRSIWN